LSRVYTGLWRALLLLETEDGGREFMFTEPPAQYEDVERYLWKLQSWLHGENMGYIEGKRVTAARMVEVVA
jgi:hypothetical protein